MNSFFIIYPEEKATCSNFDKWSSETINRLTRSIDELTVTVPNNHLIALEDVGSLKDQVGILEKENVA